MGSADTPKYTDLMNWIREQILSGEFTIGMRLPSENELGKKFSISRQTVRQATSVLESEGLLERRRGSGTTFGTAPRQRYVCIRNFKFGQKKFFPQYRRSADISGRLHFP